MSGILPRGAAAWPALVVALLVAVAGGMPLAAAFRAKLATAVIVGGPGSATGDAGMRTLMSLRPHIATVQFRDQESSAAAADAWQAAGVPPGYTLHLAPADRDAKHATGVLYSDRLVVCSTAACAAPRAICRGVAVVYN